MIDGYSYGLNYGFVGFGSDNSRGSFDSISVQVLPPQITHDATEDFAAGDGACAPVSGSWSAQGGRYGGAATSGTTAISSLDLGLDAGLASNSYVALDTTFSTSALAGIAFDLYARDDYKFVALDFAAQKVLIGHLDPRRGWTVDASVAKALTAGDTALSLVLQGSVVGVSVGGLLITSYAFGSAIADGAVGVLARGSASFDSFRIRTNDPQFAAAALPIVSIAGASVAEGAAATTKIVTLTLTLSSAAKAGRPWRGRRPTPRRRRARITRRRPAR